MMLIGISMEIWFPISRYLVEYIHFFFKSLTDFIVTFKSFLSSFKKFSSAYEKSLNNSKLKIIPKSSPLLSESSDFLIPSTNPVKISLFICVFKPIYWGGLS